MFYDQSLHVRNPIQDLPTVFGLFPAFPNPFNPSTTINFALPQASSVKLTVYNQQGSVVADLVNGWREAGYHEVTFDGAGLVSGIYFYRIEAGDFSAAKKMVLLK